MKAVLKSYWGSYTPKGQFWLGLGLIMLAVDAALSFMYGITQTTLHGIGFALVAVMFAVLPDAAREEWEEGRKVGALVLGILCIPIGAVAYYSHIGYGAGVRVGDIQRATVQNVKYDDAREEVEDAKRTEALFVSRLAALEKDNGWAASATASSMRARLPALELAIQQEAARGGCKTVCLQRTKERDDLVARIKTLEARADFTEKIEAARRVIAAAREKSAKTAHVQSSVVNQTAVGAQLWLAFNGADPAKAIKPDEVTSSFTNLMIAGIGALAFMLLAPIGIYKAGRNRRKDEEPIASTPANAPEPTPAPIHHAVATVPPIEHRHTPPRKMRINCITVDDLMKAA